MKKFLLLFSTILMVSFILPTTASACFPPVLTATISPGGGRCAVPAGVPTVYTGTHDFSSSGCTTYEWTITGGTMTGPGGIFAADGQTLCVTESIACFPDLSIDCDVVDTDGVNVASGGGSIVTVTWLPGVVGTLSLKAKEKGSTTLDASTSITNDISVPTPDYLDVISSSTSSTTLNAVFSTAFCPNTTVRWTVDGVPAGIGNPKTFPYGTCDAVSICAFTTQSLPTGTLTSGTSCRTLWSGVFGGSITGPNEVNVGGSGFYTLNSTMGITSASWYSTNPSIVEIAFPTIGSTGALFLAPGGAKICVQGTTECGTTFDICKDVFSSSGGMMMGADGELDTDNNRGGVELAITPEDLSSPSTKDVATQGITAMSMYPSPASKGQEISLQLPTVAENAMLTITDMQGRTLWQQKATGPNEVIRTEELPVGIYLLTAQAGEWMETRKFVIN